MKIRQYLIPSLLIIMAIGLVISIYVATYQKPKPTLQVGVSLPQSVAVFETSLQSPITSSATTLTLTANSVRGGGALTGYNCFTIDEGSAQAEYICGTVSATTVSSLTRGVSPTTGTTTVSALQFAHRRGANVKITDFPVIQILRAQANGQDTYPNILQYANTVCSVSSPNAAICDKAYVDGVAVAGASNANETTKGIVELSTTAEAAAGTSAGGTGARLAIPTSMCSSSFSAATLCVITGAAGKIAQGFLNLRENFSFGSSTTMTATTTIAASSTQGNPLILNNIAYAFPGTQGASSTALQTNGAGALSWIPIVRAISASTTNATSNATASTTMATVLIPANTINLASALRITSMWGGTGSGGQCYYDVTFGNGVSGTTTIGFASNIDPGAGSGGLSRIDGTVMATSSTNGIGLMNGTQSATVFVPAGAGAVQWYKGGYLSVNFAATTYVAFRVANGTATNCNLIGETVEVIQ